ncbi:GNAT family N-acetyltransferase [Roseibium sp.]|uniref:GNAT family N-acetyltransferase n=1 Tax=Roseibium sp. TaxID=1936156 RepID=UPI003BB0C772
MTTVSSMVISRKFLIFHIFHEENLAGFALVRHDPFEESVIDMGQFFVLGCLARKGVGKTAFRLCLDRHHGDWQIRVLPENKQALGFWRSCISENNPEDITEYESSYQGKAMKYFRFSVRK